MSFWVLAEVDNEGFKVLNSGGTEIDPATESKLEQVRALLQTIDADTSALAAVDYATQTTLATLATESKLEAVRALLATIDADTSSIAAEDFATQTTLATLATESKLEAVRALLATIDADTSSIAAEDFATEATLAAVLADTAAIQTAVEAIRDTAGVKKITDALPAGTNRLGAVRLVDPSDADLPHAEGDTATGVESIVMAGVGDGNVRRFALVEDAIDGIWRLAIQGKVSIGAPTPPPATTEVVIENNDPLSLGGGGSPDDEEHTIASGKTFTLQTVEAGAEGDASESGSRIDVVYVDSGSTEHLVAREFVSGFTVSLTPDTDKARDGTVMTGDGVNTKIILRRVRLSGGSLELDAVAKGFES